MTAARYLSSRLLLEDDERADDVQAGLDHRRELAGEDLQRLRLDRLEDAADAVLAARGQLVRGSRASRPRMRSCSRAAARSGAWISPESSRPWALIAE